MLNVKPSTSGTARGTDALVVAVARGTRTPACDVSRVQRVRLTVAPGSVTEPRRQKTSNTCVAYRQAASVEPWQALAASVAQQAGEADRRWQREKALRRPHVYS